MWFSLCSIFFLASIEPRHFALHSCWRAQSFQRGLAVDERYGRVGWVRRVFQVWLWYLPFAVNAGAVDVGALAPLHRVQNNRDRRPAQRDEHSNFRPVRHFGISYQEITSALLNSRWVDIFLGAMWNMPPVLGLRRLRRGFSTTHVCGLFSSQ